MCRENNDREWDSPLLFCLRPHLQPNISVVETLSPFHQHLLPSHLTTTHYLPKMESLSGQTLLLPPTTHFLRTWKSSSPPQFPPSAPHPLHNRLTEEVINPILSSLIPQPKALQKAIEYDTALLVCGLYPSLAAGSEDFEKLKTVAVWVVWIVLWDDAIDSDSSGGINAREYVEVSKRYVRWCLLREGEEEPDAPTKVCELMKSAGGRLRGVNGWGEGDVRRLWGVLECYMDGCLVEYRVRMSGTTVAELRLLGDEVGEQEFWAWRTGTSGVGAFCLMGRVMNGGEGLSGEVWRWEEVRGMEMMVIKSFVV
ncbi:hypothetical protein QC763_407285 [Podospora pseudopauciseta]|uniref:Terpene synthase n=1 Tax=Podospora pseudopauciseta TaxID=2093780 RepID=A0ABR0HDC4_9PEZI|nr:hypothetical protein QC763_407285 [Podospora pseudopauciseta]